MKVKELVSKLLTLPPEAEVYTEQWNSNKINKVLIATPPKSDKSYVYIGDDLDINELFLKESKHSVQEVKYDKAELPIYEVKVFYDYAGEASDTFSQFYTNRDRAFQSFKDAVAAQKKNLEMNCGYDEQGEINENFAEELWNGADNAKWRFYTVDGDIGLFVTVTVAKILIEDF